MHYTNDCNYLHKFPTIVSNVRAPTIIGMIAPYKHSRKHYRQLLKLTNKGRGTSSGLSCYCNLPEVIGFPLIHRNVPLCSTTASSPLARSCPLSLPSSHSHISFCLVFSSLTETVCNRQPLWLTELTRAKFTPGPSPNTFDISVAPSFLATNRLSVKVVELLCGISSCFPGKTRTGLG